MPLFTGRGDNGTTQLFGARERVPKNSQVIEALGTIDEVNALLGVVKCRGEQQPAVDSLTFSALLDDVQQDLFVIQAELAGAPKTLTSERVKKIEQWIQTIEAELPPIASFFVSGGTELSALCDYARTIARRAERCIVAVWQEDVERDKHQGMLAYMNRLSSLLYALARLANHRTGITDKPPRY